LKKVKSQKELILVEEGQFQQEEAANKQRLSSIKTLIEEVISTGKKLKESSQDESFSNAMESCIGVFEAADATNLSTDVAIRALSSAIRAKDSEMGKTKSKFEQEEKDIQKKIDELR
jgi:translation initiation factor 2B subunit (eIF-2B alpha/beta/delta family)